MSFSVQAVSLSSAPSRPVRIVTTVRPRSFLGPSDIPLYVGAASSSSIRGVSGLGGEGEGTKEYQATLAEQ